VKILGVDEAVKAFNAAKAGDAITYFRGGHKSGIRETLYEVCGRLGPQWLDKASRACGIRKYTRGLYEANKAHLVCRHHKDGLEYMMVKR